MYTMAACKSVRRASLFMGIWASHSSSSGFKVSDSCRSIDQHNDLQMKVGISLLSCRSLVFDQIGVEVFCVQTGLIEKDQQ